jgi:IS5 family transposase
MRPTTGLAAPSIRAKVEHLFNIVKNLFRHCKTATAVLQRTALLLTLFGMGNLMLAETRLIAIDAQGAF